MILKNNIHNIYSIKYEYAFVYHDYKVGIYVNLVGEYSIIRDGIEFDEGYVNEVGHRLLQECLASRLNIEFKDLEIKRNNVYYLLILDEGYVMYFDKYKIIEEDNYDKIYEDGGVISFDNWVVKRIIE